MVAVAQTRQVCADADQRVGKPASALHVAVPAVEALNHELGHKLGGLRVWQNMSGTPVTTTGSFHYKVDRHPNCDYLAVMLRLNSAAQESASVTVRAGAGTIQTHSISTGLTSSFADRVLFMAPWDSNDADTLELLVSTVDVGVQSIVAHDWPRTELGSADDAVEYIDAACPRCGLREEDALTDSLSAGVKGLLDGVHDAWYDRRDQIVAWADPRSTPLTVIGNSYQIIFGDSNDMEIVREAPQKLASDNRTTCVAWVYAKTALADPGYTFDLKVTATNPGAGADDNAESTGNSDITLTWIEVGDVEVDCTTNPQIKLEVRTNDAAGPVYVGGFCVIKKKES